MSRPYEFTVDARIPAQVSFWNDPSTYRAFVGGLGSGKSFAGAVEILRMPPGTTGLVVAPTYKHIRDNTQTPFFDFFDSRTRGFYKHNKSENVTVLANHTRILWRSTENPDTIRGPNISWIWGDEYAYVSRAAHLIVLGRLRLAPGVAWFTTTPNGQNWFYDWATGPGGVSIHHAHTKDNPYNLASYHERLAREYAGDPLYAAQELAGAFVDLSGTKRFPPLLVESCYAPRPLLPVPSLPVITVGSATFAIPHTLRVYREPVEGVEYRIGVDCAEGIQGGDDSTIVVVDRATGETCAVLGGEFEPEEEHGAYIAMLSRWYNGAPALVERNNHGHAVGASIDRHDVERLEGEDQRPGWATTGPSKAAMCLNALARMQEAERDGVKMLCDIRTKEQIKGIDRTTLRGPGKGRITKVDDLFIAWALAQQARTIDPGPRDLFLMY